MATGYSTLFSLGLSNIHTSLPREFDASGGPNSAITLSATPSTPSSSCHPFAPPPPPKIQIDTQLPNSHMKARRRRSSITAAQSPLASMGVKSPGISASRAAVSPAKARHRRSESDAVLRLKASSSLEIQRCVPLKLVIICHANAHTVPNRTRRGAVKTPAQAPPDAPLPAVPALPAEYAVQRASSVSAKTSSPIRPPSDIPCAYAYRRTYLSDKDHALNAGTRYSIPAPPSATSTGSCLLTPGFASKLVLALSTPPHSAYSGSVANTAYSPVDPVLGSENQGSYHFGPPASADVVMKEN